MPDQAPNHPCNTADRGVAGHLEFIASIITSEFRGARSINPVMLFHETVRILPPVGGFTTRFFWRIVPAGQQGLPAWLGFRYCFFGLLRDRGGVCCRSTYFVGAVSLRGDFYGRTHGAFLNRTATSVTAACAH